MLAGTRRNFTMVEVSADKAYLSHLNVFLIAITGAKPFIPFKSNTTKGQGTPAWRDMWHLYSLHREEFMAHYHKRSNVETAFSSIKRKFGGSVRSKLLVTQTNEVLLKVLCYNLSTLVHSMHELGIDPSFAKVA